MHSHPQEIIQPPFFRAIPNKHWINNRNSLETNCVMYIIVQNKFDKQICKLPCLRWFIFSPCNCLFLVYFRCFIFSLSVVVFHRNFLPIVVSPAYNQQIHPNKTRVVRKQTDDINELGDKSLVCDGCAHTHISLRMREWVHAYVCVGERMQIFIVNAQCRLGNSRNVATHTCNGTNWTKWPHACSLKPSIVDVRARLSSARASANRVPCARANACLQALAHRPTYMCRATQMQNNWETDAHTQDTHPYMLYAHTTF